MAAPKPEVYLHRRCFVCETPKTRDSSHCDSHNCPWCGNCAPRTKAS